VAAPLLPRAASQILQCAAVQMVPENPAAHVSNRARSHRGRTVWWDGELFSGRRTGTNCWPIPKRN
jgi:hypothetical protein